MDIVITRRPILIDLDEIWSKDSRWRAQYRPKAKPVLQIEKPRWRRSPSWIYVLRYNSAIHWPILTKFCPSTRDNMPSGPNWNRKYRSKNQDGDGRHLGFTDIIIIRPNIDRSRRNLIQRPNRSKAKTVLQNEKLRWPRPPSWIYRHKILIDLDEIWSKDSRPHTQPAQNKTMAAVAILNLRTSQ